MESLILYKNLSLQENKLLEDFLNCVCEDLALHPELIKKPLLDKLIEVRGQAYSYILKKINN